MSNNDPDDHIYEEYVRLTHHRRKVQRELNDVRDRMKEIAPTIISQMQADDTESIEIKPTKREEKFLGTEGYLRIRNLNRPVSWTRHLLTTLIQDFFTRMMPEASEENVNYIANGMVEMIVTNRPRERLQQLDRVYLEDVERDRALAKRRREAQQAREEKGGDEEKEEQEEAIREPPRKRAFVRRERNVPSSREEFMEVEPFRRLCEAGQQQQQQPHANE